MKIQKKLIFISLGTILVISGLLILVAAAFLASLFKDGMGPGAIESTGVIASARFMDGFVGCLPTVTGLFALGAVCFWMGFRKAL